jgi:hypothetical protein
MMTETKALGTIHRTPLKLAYPILCTSEIVSVARQVL